MRKLLYIVALFFLAGQSASAQYLAKYMLLPKKYSAPDYMVSTSTATEFTDEIWRAYTDRDSVLVYEDRYLSTVIDTLNFLESFVVWEESEYALRIVSQADSGEMFSGKVFGDGAIERGWVDKNQMILWPRTLSKDGLVMKVIAAKSIVPLIRDPHKPTRNIDVPEGEFRIFNVLKIDGSNLLLFTTDLVHEGLERYQAFWVDKKDIILLNSRQAYIPSWEKVLEGDSIPVYSSLSASEDESVDGILYSIDKLNTFTGFFSQDELNILGLAARSPYKGRYQEVYLNNVFNDYKKAILVDLHQFLIYKEFIDIFSSYDFYDPEQLEEELVRFFKSKGLNIDEMEFMSIGAMLELITGIQVGTMLEQDIRVVGNMSQAGRRHLLERFLDAREIYEDDQKLGLYRFYSDMAYYWLPTDWLLPDEIYSLSLKKKEPPAPPAREYRNYEMYYIDGSYVSGIRANVFDKIFDDLRKQLNRSTEKVIADSTFGFYVYMSNGLNTIKNDYKIPMERTVEDVLLTLRDGTYAANRKSDRMILESELLLHQIETISESLTMHYYIPERFLREDIEERCYMIRELADRIFSLAMPKNSTKVTINLHIYSIYDERHLSEVIKEMKEIYFPDSKYAFNIKVEQYN